MRACKKANIHSGKDFFLCINYLGIIWDMVKVEGDFEDFCISFQNVLEINIFWYIR